MEQNHNNGMVSGLNGKFAHWLDKETSGETNQTVRSTAGKRGKYFVFNRGKRQRNSGLQ